jgi:amidase
MHRSQWTYASAADLAQALRDGKASAVELARDAIKRIESADPALNAMCVKTYETALAEAAEADARLARGERGALIGVPMTTKESFNLAGYPTTWGYPEARDYRPAEDALIVSRAKAAGAVILGKTNVPLALDDAQTYNPIYGVTKSIRSEAHARGLVGRLRGRARRGLRSALARVRHRRLAARAGPFLRDLRP